MVLGILFIMIGLLLPAVQAARSAARRISCESRLRQIGQAAMQYHDAYRLLPNGTASDSHRCRKPLGCSVFFRFWKKIGSIS